MGHTRRGAKSGSLQAVWPMVGASASPSWGWVVFPLLGVCAPLGGGFPLLGVGAPSTPLVWMGALSPSRGWVPYSNPVGVPIPLLAGWVPLLPLLGGTPLMRGGGGCPLPIQYIS